MLINADVSLFQFHEGPIKTCERASEACTRQCFNSMKVRLKQITFNYFCVTFLFQFHEGPIKTGARPRAMSLLLRFNSMKVRLKPVFLVPSLVPKRASIP